MNVLYREIEVTQGSLDDAIKTMELIERIYNADPVWQAKGK